MTSRKRSSFVVPVTGLALIAVGVVVCSANACCGLGPAGGDAGLFSPLLIIPIVGLALVWHGVSLWMRNDDG
jgi:hypothetical protein